ncbi:MAG: glycine oxidase ThiO [Terriglobia bacterium]
MENVMNQKNWDVIIVGAGIIGMSIAWKLAQKKLHVLVLERNEPGREASYASAGMLAPYTEAEEDTPLLRLAIASRGIYPEFLGEIESETGMSAHYRDEGALFLALDEHEVKTLESRFEWQKKMGFAVERLQGRELQSAEPALSSSIKLALFYPGDHQLDNRAWLAALQAALKKRGVEIRTGIQVHRLSHEGGRVTGVEADRERISAKVTVLAAGAWSPAVETGTRESLPVYPTRGQIVAVKSPQPLFRHTLRYEGGYVAVFPEGRLLLGGTMEDVGYSKANTVSALQNILARAGDYAPAIGSCEWVEAWSGLRPNTRDHFPILGRSSCEGLVYATGHFRNGILLTPITATAISDLIVNGQTSVDLAPFSIERFQGENDRGR